jgi:hypothetical protein
MRKFYNYLFLTLFVAFAATPGLAQLSGTYTIDNTGSGDYLTFAEALTALEAQGVNGPVIFEVTGGQIFTENIQIDTIYTGVNSTNTIIFRYIGDNKPVVQPSSSSTTAGVIDIRFDGDHYLTFEGLKIKATNGPISRAKGIRLTWGPDYVTIRNCEITDFTEDGIFVYWGGSITRGNACEHALIEGNDIYHEDVISTSSAAVRGIHVNGCDSTIVRNNFVHDLIGGTNRVAGIRTTGTADTNDVEIYNNFITIGQNITSDIRIYGLLSEHSAGPTIEMYYNSIYLNGTVDVALQYTAAARLQNSATTLFNDNIAFNDRRKNSGAGNHYTIYMGAASNQYTGDYNDLYTSGSVFAYRAGDIANFLSWQTTTGQDANSISQNPQYVGTTDLHVLPTSPVANVGTPITGITTDIEGDARDIINPDIGADEFPDNRAPQITSTPVITTLEDQLYSYQVQAQDPDYGDTLTFDLLQNPAFLSIDENTGLITGTPVNDDVGPHTVEVEATDLTGATGTQLFTLTVQNVNDAPTISDIGDQSTDEDTPTGSIAFTVGDIDNDPAILTMSGNSNNLALVNPASFAFGGSGTDRTVVITPRQDQFGSATVTVTVSDGDLTANDTFVLTVDPINDGPVVSDILDQSVEEGSSFVAINLDDHVSDVDNDDSELSWGYAGNSELTVDINPTTRVAVISIPNAEWNGEETITFTASDPGLLSDNDAATFTVTPVNDPPVVTDIPDQSVAEGESFVTITLDDFVSDIDNAVAEMTWSASEATNLSITIVDRVATITVLDENWNGDETITFTATDPGALSDGDDVTFTVTPVNDAPVISDIPDATIAEGGNFADIILDDYVNDVDNDDAEISWSASETTNLTVTIVDRVASISLNDPEWNGNETVTFTATDPGELSDTDDATFTVTSVADPPVVTDIPDQTVAEGESFAIISLDDFVSDLDNTDDEITWSASETTNLTVSIVDRVAMITVNDENWNGNETVTFTATDPTLLSNSDAATFTVTPINDAPVLSDIPDQTITEGGVFATINLDEHVTDVDNADAELNWEASGNVELTVAIDENRIVTIGIPDENWSGSETVLFKVTDPGGLADSNTTILTVDAVNDPPQIVGDLPAVQFDEDDSLNYSIADLYEYVEDAETADSNLIYLVMPSDYVYGELDSPFVVFKALAHWFGADTLTVIVSDGELFDTAQVFVTVNPVNDAPYVVELPDTVTFIHAADTVLSMGDYVEDVDNADAELNWEFSVSNDTLKFEFDAESMNLTLSAPGFIGEVTLSFTVTDDSSASVSDSIIVKVIADPTGINDWFFGVPDQYSLNQNYPNPFNPLTHIRFGLPKAGDVKIELYNILGQHVATLLSEFKQAGYHVVDLDASHLPSGVYFYRIQATRFNDVKKMILLK